MTAILQDKFPDEMTDERVLPGVAPLAAQDWLRVDEAYAGQMRRRRDLLQGCPEQVVFQDGGAAAIEVLEMALALLPGLGFQLGADWITGPDGIPIEIDWAKPLMTLGQLVQEDLCILEKRGPEHILTAAVLCFPASWSLAEKAGRPLSAIHTPVDSYDAPMARRVQRLFDGVRAGRPLWRFNRLHYADPELFQPRRSDQRRQAPSQAQATYDRAERQCIVRLPRTDAVLFSIHTYVVAAAKRGASTI
jgi:hypothetical protein